MLQERGFACSRRADDMQNPMGLKACVDLIDKFGPRQRCAADLVFNVIKCQVRRLSEANGHRVQIGSLPEAEAVRLR